MSEKEKTKEYKISLNELEIQAKIQDLQKDEDVKTYLNMIAGERKFQELQKLVAILQKKE